MHSMNDAPKLVLERDPSTYEDPHKKFDFDAWFYLLASVDEVTYHLGITNKYRDHHAHHKTHVNQARQRDPDPDQATSRRP